MGRSRRTRVSCFLRGDKSYRQPSFFSAGSATSRSSLRAAPYLFRGRFVRGAFVMEELTRLCAGRGRKFIQEGPQPRSGATHIRSARRRDTSACLLGGQTCGPENIETQTQFRTMFGGQSCTPENLLEKPVGRPNSHCENVLEKHLSLL